MTDRISTTDYIAASLTSPPVTHTTDKDLREWMDEQEARAQRRVEGIAYKPTTGVWVGGRYMARAAIERGGR